MLTIRHGSLQWNNKSETTRNQESSQYQIKLPVLFYEVYFLTPEEKIKNKSPWDGAAAKLVAFQLHLYLFCENMFLMGGLPRSRYCNVFLT